MTKSHILALDIAQTSALSQLDFEGTKLWGKPLLTSEAGFQQLDTELKRRGIRYEHLLCVVEATGVYHLPWAERLSQAGAKVHVLNPLLASKLESSANALRGHKTDQVDVAKLAEVSYLHAQKLERFTYRSDPAVQGRRQLDHARAMLRESLTNLKKSAQSHLELVFPALLVAGIAADSACAARILEKVHTAGQWLQLPIEERCQLARGKHPALDAACHDTLAPESVALACAPALLALLGAQSDLADRLKKCEQSLHEAGDQERLQLIASIPGFGERTACVLDIYLPHDLPTWGNKKKQLSRLQALYGVDPRLCSSGKWTGTIKISKRGIRSVRLALFQAAFCSIRVDSEMATYYGHLRSKGKSHKAAIIDLIRKQLRRLVCVLNSRLPFRSPLSSTPKSSLAA
jgi:transposase